jgi:hypothetical protein
MKLLQQKEKNRSFYSADSVKTQLFIVIFTFIFNKNIFLFVIFRN